MLLQICLPCVFKFSIGAVSEGELLYTSKLVPALRILASTMCECIVNRY